MSQPNIARTAAQESYKYHRWYWQLHKELQTFGLSIEWYPVIDFPTLYTQVSDPGTACLTIIFGLQLADLPRAVA